MKEMLLSAFYRITQGVKTEIQPVNARLMDALKRAKDSLVAFCLSPEHTNCWEPWDEENLGIQSGFDVPAALRCREGSIRKACCFLEKGGA